MYVYFSDQIRNRHNFSLLHSASIDIDFHESEVEPVHTDNYHSLPIYNNSILPKVPKQAQFHGNPVSPLMWFQKCNKSTKLTLMFDTVPL